MRHGIRLLCIATLGPLGGCSLIPEPPPEQECAVRGVFYPDENGDGVGEPTGIYVGCSAPEGWVETVDFFDPDTDVTDTDVADSDTDVADTDVADSDTDVADTDVADSDSDVVDSDTSDSDTDPDAVDTDDSDVG